MNTKAMLETLDEITLLVDELLKSVTFIKTGGLTDVLALPKTEKEVEEIVTYYREQGLSRLVLGNASNLIVRGSGIRDVVIMLTEMKEIKVTGTTMIVDVGAKLIDTTYEALAADSTGFEFAYGIPGSVGGAVCINAGAYGGEIKDVFQSTEVLLADGTIQTMTKEDLNFRYRHSEIQELHCIALQVTFALEKGNRAEIKAQVDELTELRELKQPLEYPSYGSVFKRPVGHFTGKLIQDVGLQGLKWGGAQISEEHVGFIVNTDHTATTGYVELIAHIQEVIREKFDVELQTEVRIIGEEV